MGEGVDRLGVDTRQRWRCSGHTFAATKVVHASPGASHSDSSSPKQIHIGGWLQ